MIDWFDEIGKNLPTHRRSIVTLGASVADTFATCYSYTLKRPSSRLTITAQLWRSPDLPWIKRQDDNKTYQKKIKAGDDVASTSKTNIAAGEATNKTRGRRDRWETCVAELADASPVTAVREGITDWIRTEWNNPPSNDIREDASVMTTVSELPRKKKSNSATEQVKTPTVDILSGKNATTDKPNVLQCSQSLVKFTKSSSEIADPTESSLYCNNLDDDAKVINGSSFKAIAKDMSIRINANASIAKAEIKRSNAVPTNASSNEDIYLGITTAENPKVLTISPSAGAADITDAEKSRDSCKASTTVKQVSTVIITDGKKARNSNQIEADAWQKVYGKKNVTNVKSAKVQPDKLCTPIPERSDEYLKKISSLFCVEMSQTKTKATRKMISDKVNPDKTSPQSVKAGCSAKELKRVADMFCVENEAQRKERKNATYAIGENVNIKKQRAAKVAPNMFNRKIKPAKLANSELVKIAALFCVESEENAMARRKPFSDVGEAGDGLKGPSKECIAVDSQVIELSDASLKKMKPNGHKRSMSYRAAIGSGTYLDRINEVHPATEAKENAEKSGSKKRRNIVARFFRNLRKRGNN